MFPYQDPTGSDFLKRHAALDVYRSKLQLRYEIAAQQTGSRFVPIERLHSLKSGQRFDVQTVHWEAFPIKQAGASDDRIDRDREFLQEEYIEWGVKVDQGKLASITFCTEFPEYFEALADVSFEALVAGLRQVLPGANPTVQELMGQATPPPKLLVDGIVGPATWTMLDRVTGLSSRGFDQPFLRRGNFGQAVARLQERLRLLNLVQLVDGDFGPRTEQAVKTAQQRYTGGGHFFRQQLAQNPWNNGKDGIYCLLQRDNKLSLLFNLLSQCAIPRPQERPETTCQRVGTRNCIPERSSDPNVCSATQRAVQSDRVISLLDPVKIRMTQLTGIWTLNGQRIDINDRDRNQGIWQVSRGGQRGVLRVVPGLALDGSSIRTGSQVARKLIVGADVAVAPASALL